MGKLCQAFFERDVLNSEVAVMLESNLILLSTQKKSLDFSRLTYKIKIVEACYTYDPHSDSLKIREREKKEFRDLVQIIYLQILLS